MRRSLNHMPACSLGRTVVGLVVLLAAATPAQGDEPSPHAPRPVRVRVEWGSKVPQAWNGLVEVSNGRFERPSSLGVEADEPGTIWVEGGAVWLRRRSPRIYDGFDVSVHASAEATLNFTLQSEGKHPQRSQFTVNLAEIGPQTTTLAGDDAELRLMVRRAPGDDLAVQIDRPHLIFAPNDELRATISFDASLDGNVDRELTWQLCPARSRRVLSRQSLKPEQTSRVAANETLPVTIPLPHDEGAYDIHFVESHNGEEANRRSVQVLVLGREPASAAAVSAPANADRLVDSFRPGSGHVFRHISPKSNRKAIGQAVSNLFSFVPNLSRTEEAPNIEPVERVQWDAYKLRVRHPGQPHRLVVTANASREQSLGISLMEPNAAGQLMPVGLDSGIYIRGIDSTSASAAQTSPSRATESHELIFWPKVREPVVLLHNMAAGRPIDVERIELSELDRLTPAARNMGISNSEAPLRMVGPYLHAPLLPENFGASEAFDAESGRSLDDWTTFHTAATRASEYLHYAGYNSLMLSVLADGSTIYPSELLQPTPRYDTGVFFSSGQDPMRKDVLELMFQLFDREKLELIPHLQFSSPLPVLERAITDDGHRAAGIELVGRDGRSWREARGSKRGLAPYYNPLNPQVQQAVIDVVAELANRYHSHRSFVGLAVELDCSGYLQLPGMEWGLDDDTVARFEKSTGIDVGGGHGNDRFAKRFQALSTTHANRWQRWRCDELARFHRRLADTLTARKPTARFILAGKNVCGGNQSDDDIDEAVRTGRKLETLLAARGLDFNLYANHPGITVLRPSLWRAPEQPLVLALDDALNSSNNLKTLLANCRQGSLFYHTPRECRISDFDAVSPWQPAYTWLAAQASVAGAENRKPFVQSLAAGDAQMIFDGGWLLPMGQERTTLNTRQIIASLPAVPFHLGNVQRQPVSVRSAKFDGATWIYAVNEFPQPVIARLNLSCNKDAVGVMLPHGESLVLEPVAAEQSGCVATLHLEAYGLWACKLNDGQVTVQSIEVDVPQASKETLAVRIRRFDEQIGLMRTQEQAEQTGVTNPGFEDHPERDGELPGWELPVQNAAQWSLDETNPRSGNSSLMLASTQGNVASLSSPLALDDARLLTVSVWLRSDQDAADVRLTFEATVAGQTHVRHVPAKVDREWRHYVFRVTDIPAEKLDAGTVRIEMRGSGKLWIDDVDIQRSRLSPDDLRQISKVYSAVTIAWNEGRYADCERLLDGYWGQLPFDEATTRKSSPEPSRTAEGLRRFFRRQ